MLSSDDFLVIAAVNDDEVLANCLMRSPDVESGALRVVPIRGASCMAQAYNLGLDQTEAAIAILAHQDVYLPSGWLDRAIEALTRLTADDPAWQVAGVYGVCADGRHVGHVYDVAIGRELGGPFDPTRVGSFDELLMILRLDTPHRFDEQLPSFHLYGTDLVQSVVAAGRSAYALHLPVVHNSRPIETLRGGYERAYHYVRRKWRDRLPIPTSVCPVTNNPLPLWRVHWRRFKTRGQRQELLADAKQIAVQVGFER